MIPFEKFTEQARAAWRARRGCWAAASPGARHRALLLVLLGQGEGLVADGWRRSGATAGRCWSGCSRTSADGPRDWRLLYMTTLA